MSTNTLDERQDSANRVTPSDIGIEVAPLDIVIDLAPSMDHSPWDLVLAPAEPRAEHLSRHPSLEAYLEVARLILVGILFAIVLISVVTMATMGPFGFFPVILLGMLYPVYLGVSFLERLAAGPP